MHCREQIRCHILKIIACEADRAKKEMLQLLFQNEGAMKRPNRPNVLKLSIFKRIVIIQNIST
jgi:hypothetical protein